MNNKAKDLVIGVCTLAEIVGISMLTYIALKRNNDCYKAEMACIDAELKLANSSLDCVIKDITIKKLSDEITELKKQQES